MQSRNIFRIITGLTLLISSSAFSEPAPLGFQPQSLRVVPNNTFIPAGFDDNDTVEVVVSGTLQNTCYRAGSAKVQVDENEMKVVIQNTVNYYPGCWCAEVSSNYKHTVSLGVLKAGKYEVLVQDQKNNSHSQGVLNVAVSKTAAPDDYLYAPVQHVLLENSNPTPHSSQPNSDARTIAVRGILSSDCMHLQEMKVSYQTPHIIEILPIASMDQNPNCHAASIPFESRVKVQSPWTGSTLIYVRSLNGQAVSEVVEL